MAISLHRIGVCTCKVVEKNRTDAKKRKEGRERRKEEDSRSVRGADFGGAVDSQRNVKPSFKPKEPILIHN